METGRSSFEAEIVGDDVYLGVVSADSGTEEGSDKLFNQREDKQVWLMRAKDGTLWGNGKKGGDGAGPVGKDDRLLGFKASRGDRDLLTVETNRGAKKNISTVKYRTTSRGGVGTEIQKNGRIKRIVADEVPAPVLKGRAPKGGL